MKLLTITGIETDDDESMKKLKIIIKMLTKKDRLGFEFLREDFYLDEKELVKYRSEVPQYFKVNGQYEIKFKICEKRFRGIGYLPITEETYNQILVCWKYFEMLVFFNPGSMFSFQDFSSKYKRKNVTIPAVDFIRNKHASSVFIKDNEGDTLRIIYNYDDFDKKLITSVMEVVGSQFRNIIGKIYVNYKRAKIEATEKQFFFYFGCFSIHES